MRFTQYTSLANSVIAIDFLESLHLPRSTGKELLRDIGDKCLLFSGLFPGRAERHHVKISYFVNIGQSAYHILADNSTKELAVLFTSLSGSFVMLMDILQATRALSQNTLYLQPLLAAELWQDTGSQYAYQILNKISKGHIIREMDLQTLLKH